MTTALLESPLLLYWCKANGYLTLFYGFYWLLLRRHTFLHLNRVYLLASVVVAGLLPLVNIPGLAWPWSPDEPVLATVSVDMGTVMAVVTTPAAPLLPDWPTLTFWLAVVVAVGLLIRTGWRTGALLRLIRQWPAQVLPHYTLVRPTDARTPTFSFFRYLILNPDDAHTEAVRQHELVHIRQWHSVDVLLLEVLQALCWPNPALFGYRRAIRQVHEYLADRDALTHAATDRDTYARFLLDYAFHLPPDGLTHSFGPDQPESPTLKQRIQMLYQQHTSRRALWKYALVLPLATALLAMTTRPEPTTETALTAPLALANTPSEASSGVLADTLSVEGRVIDRATRKPLPGANIVIKNGTRGTTTDSEGNFKLALPNNDAVVLVVSFVGFKPEERPINAGLKRVILVVSLESTTADVSSMPVATAPSTTTASIGTGDKKEVFTVVEQAPMFPGGNQALFKFVSDNIQYPEAASKAHVSGKVFVSFVVNTDGSLSDIQILKGIGFGCDAEAVRVMKAMPNWIPGHQSGHPVAVRYNLPIDFRFREKKTGYVPKSEKSSDSEHSPRTLAFLLDTVAGHEPVRFQRMEGVGFSFPSSGLALSDGREPLFFINGKKADKAMMSALEPNSIQSINVLKNSYARDRYKEYGDEAKYGVVEIFTKKKDGKE